MIHVYAFAERAPAAEPPDGIEGAAVELLDAGGLAAAVSRHERAPGASEASVRAHAAVVDALARAGVAVLPARFGLAYADETALVDAVAARAGELRQGFERVRGRVELGLRVLAPDEPGDGAAPASGADYLRARLAAAQARERLAGEVYDALAAAAREATRAGGPGGRLLLSAAYLVDEAAVDGFRRELEALQSAHADLAFVCTGPWPAYSFVPEVVPQ